MAQFTNNAALIRTLDEVSKGNDECVSKFWGLFDEKDIFFGLKLPYLIFSVSEQFSCNLQAKDTTIRRNSETWFRIASYYMWNLS